MFFLFGGVTFYELDAMILSLFIGITLYFHAFYEHFAASVKEIDDLDSNNPSAVKLIKKLHAKRMLREIIQFQIIAKR